jgi:2-polyprenyl-6-methoxyphenol hydroxylase-like FAD-dependent oxidoreductase
MAGLKVLIIGAGPAGLAAALQISQSSGILFAVYEIRTEPTTLGGSIGIPSNGLRLLQRMGVYEELLARGSKSSTTMLHSSQGTDLGGIDMVSWSEKKTGFGYLRIKRTDLVDVLTDATQKRGIPIYYGKQVVAIEEGDQGVTVTFSDGTADTGDLLLGCDGIHSRVRTLYVDPKVVPEYTGISTIYSLLPTADLPPLATSVTCINATLTPDGMFALMPCTASGDTLFWFFSHEVPMPSTGNTRDGWEEKNKEEVERFKSTILEVLKDAKGEWGALLKDVVRLTGVVKFYPIFRLPLGGNWSNGRCLLLGDAAHAMQPHAGQGVSMAVEDVFLLSRLLATPSLSLSDVFEKFDGIRRPRLEKFFKLAARNAESRKRTGPLTQRLKELATWALIGVSKSCDLSKWVDWQGQRDLVYDIDEVQI